MTFSDKLAAACFVGLIILNVIPMYLPSARGRVISLYDAGMFAIYLVVLAWGAGKIGASEGADGWALVILSAGLFGWRMYSVFNQHERK